MPQQSTKTQKTRKETSTDAPRRKPKFKIIIRRLPTGLGQDELLHQIEPLDDSVIFWFRKANKLMEPLSFTRAYLVFDDWEKAVEFRTRFNGYVFVDKQGRESMAVVELAVHQEAPKSFPSDSLKTDKRVGTLEERPEYKEFHDEYNNLVLHKVTNFDELIHEMEEKEKRFAKGMIQETPLTKFLIQQATDKEKKRFDRLARHKPALLSKIEADSKKKADVNAKKKTGKDLKKKPDGDIDDPNKPVVEKENKRNRRREDRPRKPRNDDATEQNKPKRTEQPVDAKANGVPESRRKARQKAASKGDYAEFGNTVPKLLSRNQKSFDEQPQASSNDQPTTTNNDESPNNAKAHKSSKKSDEGGRESKGGRVFTNKNMKRNPPNNASSNAPDNESKTNNDEQTDDKSRRRQQRPERAIYRPPTRTREKETDKKAADSERKEAET